MKIEEILENQSVRENLIERVDVLNKVKDLLLLGNSEFATVKQVALYYEVGEKAIQSMVLDHKNELESNGLKMYKRSEILSILGGELENIKIPNRGQKLFSKRAILNVGMLLTESKIAEEVRRRLLDIEYESNNSIQENGQTVKENIVNEIDEETKLSMELGIAIIKNDTENIIRLTSEISGLKNKRIAELEGKITDITTHSLDIIESRKVINRLVRIIASKEYNCKFANCWNELWSKVNYQLSINVKARKVKPLDSLSENEMYDVEKIVRIWANQIGININEVLTLKK